jgi:antitoxin component YwqK of YwqJK toxin-antitoxin module
LFKPIGQNIRTFHKNGMLEFEGNMVNGKRHGLGIAYHPNGKPIYAGNFTSDEIQGNGIQIFFNNGRVKFEGNMIDGLKNGPGRSWDENGNLLYEGAYL